MTPEILPPLSAGPHGKPAGWRFGLGLWLPLFLLWLILLPLLLLALPLLFVASLIFRFNLWRSLRAVNGAAARRARSDTDKRDAGISIELH
jgi:hypothetical protein